MVTPPRGLSADLRPYWVMDRDDTGELMELLDVIEEAWRQPGRLVGPAKDGAR
jgi:hypothetical protein